MIWKMGVHLIITDSVYAFAWKMKIVQGNHYLYQVDYFCKCGSKNDCKGILYVSVTELYMNRVNLHNQESNVSETHD
jgi:hypothetical protein